MDKPLEGTGVLVTRPLATATAFSDLLIANGASVTLFPTIEIVRHGDPETLRSLIGEPEYDIIVFISANAVTHAVDTIAIPDQASVAAVGTATADALRAAGREPDLVPGIANSEGLLDSEALSDVAGKRILVVKGVGGLRTLEESLQRRGAKVVTAEVYRRAVPDRDTQDLEADWASGLIDATTFTSGDALRNLHQMLSDNGRELLCATPLVVPSERVAKIGVDLGFRVAPVVATGADPASMLQALIHWSSQKRYEPEK